MQIFTQSKCQGHKVYEEQKMAELNEKMKIAFRTKANKDITDEMVK